MSPSPSALSFVEERLSPDPIERFAETSLRLGWGAGQATGTDWIRRPQDNVRGERIISPRLAFVVIETDVHAENLFSAVPHVPTCLQRTSDRLDPQLSSVGVTRHSIDTAHPTSSR